MQKLFIARVNQSNDANCAHDTIFNDASFRLDDIFRYDVGRYEAKFSADIFDAQATEPTVVLHGARVSNVVAEYHDVNMIHFDATDENGQPADLNGEVYLIVRFTPISYE